MSLGHGQHQIDRIDFELGQVIVCVGNGKQETCIQLARPDTSICSRELRGLSCNSTSGCRSRNCRNESGTTPCQDMLSTNPTRNVPDCPDATRLARLVASFTSRRIRLASSMKLLPAALIFTPRGSLSNNLKPISSSKS